jgi:hypothetical protein
LKQFFADQIDQLDLALDQLAVRDRNFDRFAMMLVDNVVELTLHQYARDRSYENEMWGKFDKPKYDPDLVAAGITTYFDPKVRLARATGLLPANVAESVQALHALRNVVYHQGERHESILHSAAVFYFRLACLLLKNFAPLWWMSSSRDQISHRALKCLGNEAYFDQSKVFAAAWGRLDAVAATMDTALVKDLHGDMASTIRSVDRAIKFIVRDGRPRRTRRNVVVYSQAWPFAFTDAGNAYAARHYSGKGSVVDYVDWLAKHYPWQVRNDPVPSWIKRLASLRSETDPHAALRKYSEFMKQTETIRSQIEESAAALDAHIQQQIDVARGK